MDNLNIHRRKSLTKIAWRDSRDEVWNRFTVHYTPALSELAANRVRRGLVFSAASQQFFKMSFHLPTRRFPVQPVLVLGTTTAPGCDRTTSIPKRTIHIHPD
jgi:hypothetical protein